MHLVKPLINKLGIRLNVFHFYEDLNDYKEQHRIDLSLHLGRFKRQVCVLG